MSDSTDADRPSVSVLILNRNRRDLLKDCIEKLRENTKYNNYELIVIDNDSDDDSVPYVREHFPEIEIIENRENLGFSEANNRAIKSTDSDYVLLLNNDTEVRDGWLKPLVELAQANTDTKIVSPKLIYENGNIQFTGDKVILDESGVPSIFNTLLARIESRFDYEKEIRSSEADCWSGRAGAVKA